MQTDADSAVWACAGPHLPSGWWHSGLGSAKERGSISLCISAKCKFISIGIYIMRYLKKSSIESSEPWIKWTSSIIVDNIITFMKQRSIFKKSDKTILKSTSFWFPALLLKHSAFMLSNFTCHYVLFFRFCIKKNYTANLLSLLCSNASLSSLCVQLSSVLSSEVHSVRAGRYLACKLNVLVQQHFDLASTTITNIPMKVRLTVKQSPLCLSLSFSLHHLFALYRLLTQLLFSWFIVCFASLH